MIDRLYTLRELHERSGLSISELRDIIARGEVAVVRKTPKARIRIAESAWAAWQHAHVTATDPPPVSVRHTPPARAPRRRDTRASIDHLLPPDYVRQFGHGRKAELR